MDRRPPRTGGLRRSGSFGGATHGPFDLPLRVPLGDGLTLVGLASSATEGQLDLGPALAEVQAQGHERQTLLGDAGLQSIDLVAVQEQLAPAVGS